MIRNHERYESIPRQRIIVTQEIIDNAIESNSAHCVVADAIKAHMAAKYGTRYKNVSVDLSQIRITDKEQGKRFTYFTPHQCQRCIAQFDQGKRKALKPFTFMLQYPVQVVNTKARAGVTPEKSAAARAAGKKGAKVRAAQVASLAGNKNRRTQKKGGKQMPGTSPLGQRRQFGVKGLGDLDAPTA